MSGEEKKLKQLGRRYGVQRVCGYDGVDDLFASGEIDAGLHRPAERHAQEYTVRAAQAGLHVLCEKPMAVTSSECEEMIAATRDAKVKLMIAYRLHFERANLEAAKLARTGKLGELRFFNSEFSMQVSDDNIRLLPPDRGRRAAVRHRYLLHQRGALLPLRGSRRGLGNRHAQRRSPLPGRRRDGRSDDAIQG